jgi:aminodeoxyfutalosine synthase
MALEDLLDGYHDDDLYEIVEKSLAGEDLSREDGIALFESGNLFFIGALADELRRRAVGDVVTFVVNRHINYTNVCVSGCRFCAYFREEGQPGAYTMSMGDIMERIRKSASLGITELHIVGSHHPSLPFEFYVEMLENIKKEFPDLHLQAFTATEIKYFSEISGLSVEGVLKALIKAGLGSMPGGGAEILKDNLREELCPNKASSQEWLEVMATAHRLGLRSNATMLFGHIETKEDRVDHLLKLREVQKETGGFQAFIPLPFHPANTPLKKEGLVKDGPSGVDILKTMAISRIMLSGHIDHIRAFWVMTGKRLAQISLNYGVNDLDGTVVEERITHAAGAKTAEYTPRDDIIDLIKEAGFVPAQRTTTHEIIKVFE